MFRAWVAPSFQVANVSPACTMMAHRRTLTPRCTLCRYLGTVQLLRPSSPTHPSRRHRDIPIGLTTSTGGSPSAANICTNPHLPPKCLLTSGGHGVYFTQTARDSSALVIRREMPAPEGIADTSPSAIPRDRAEFRRQQEGRYRSRPSLGKNIQIENIAIAQTQP